MSRLLLVGLVVTIVSGSWVADALAQPDAGAKARGEFGRGFWDSGYHSGGRLLYYRPAHPSTERYRSFSYEPIGIRAGDTVAVKADDVKLMRGTNVVGVVPQGLKFKVTKEVNGWLGAVVEQNGKDLKGWIWHNNVNLEKPVPPSDGS